MQNLLIRFINIDGLLMGYEFNNKMILAELGLHKKKRIEDI